MVHQYIQRTIKWRTILYSAPLNGAPLKLIESDTSEVRYHKNHDAPTTCKAEDKAWEWLSDVFGEAYHQWHHVHPRAFHRPGRDWPYYLVIAPCLRLGIFSGKNILSESRLPEAGPKSGG